MPRASVDPKLVLLTTALLPHPVPLRILRSGAAPDGEHTRKTWVPLAGVRCLRWCLRNALGHFFVFGLAAAADLRVVVLVWRVYLLVFSSWSAGWGGRNRNVDAAFACPLRVQHAGPPLPWGVGLFIVAVRSDSKWSRVTEWPKAWKT